MTAGRMISPVPVVTVKPVAFNVNNSIVSNTPFSNVLVMEDSKDIGL